VQKVRLGYSCVVLLALAVVGCGTAAQRQAQQSGAATREAIAQFKACSRAVRDKPEYASLLVHSSDLETGQPSMAQLTDETIPSEQDARLFAERFDEAGPCRGHLLTAISAARPDLVPVLADGMTQGSAIAVLVVEQKITWAEAARRTQALSSALRQNIAAADRQWIGDLNASNQAEMAQRQAAGAALMQWSQQQQLINAATRPVVTNCNRFGSSVNCTSY
jgi:hypothetical protein